MQLTSKKTPKVKTTFSIPEDSHNTLTRFAKASGVSRSHIISEVLETVSPVLNQLSEAIESQDEEAIAKISKDFSASLSSLKERL